MQSLQQPSSRYYNMRRTKDELIYTDAITNRVILKVSHEGEQINWGNIEGN